MSPNPRYCDAIIATGTCTVQDCRLRHDIRLCSCRIVIQVPSLSQHLAGKRHREALKLIQALSVHNSTNGIPRPSVTTPQASTTRQPALQQPGQAPNRSNGLDHCEACNTDVSSSRWTQHVHSERHLRQQRALDTRTALDNAARDKNGITVSGGEDGIDFGIVEIEDALASSTSQSLPVVIKNSNVNSHIVLADLCLTSSTRRDTHGTKFTATLLGDTKEISSSRPRTVVLIFHPSYEGRYEDTLELFFHDTRRRQRFAITRRIRATVGSNDDYEELKPSKPYAKRKWTPLMLEGPIVPSLRPPTWTATKWRVRLPEFPIPANLIKDAFSRDGRNLVKQRHMPAIFDSSTYWKHFQVMLYIEEEQRSRDLDNYSMVDVELVAKHPRYNLEVAGLAENRPSVLVGDFILVKHHGSSTDKWYEGCVHIVYENYVSLRFDSAFSLYKGNKVDVRFRLNRLPTRRMHLALTTAFNPNRLLFPGLEHLRGAKVVTRDQLNDINPVNRSIGQDAEQLQTVATIVNQPPGSPPFVIFGPPGTGKTVTVVETIRQLLIRFPKARILACAPSNAAADIIAVKLIDIGQAELFRLNSKSREFKSLSKTLRAFSLYNDNKVFAVPTLEVLSKYRVIVSTCVSGGIPHGLGVRRGHFSHIFIDEAGQAMEPEVMIPIKTMAASSTNVILAGDSKQLGPSIRSGLARDLGLKQSYLFRIMARSVYDLDIGKGLTIVKLLKNFRNHPAILQFSNTMFYNGELECCGDPVLTHSLQLSEALVTRNFPLIFHGIVGKDEREASSPSFFNIDEVTMVKKYCQQLISRRRPAVRPEDIGVITPYHAQRIKIARILSKEWSEIKVGSVEEFQGTERRIIILSTVRSSTDHVRYDIKHNLGFVADSRRLNVALTRAQALLIVIGNPIVLSLDPIWRAFMNYVHINKGWKGKEIDWDPEVIPDCDGVGVYDRERRNQAEGEADEMVMRLKSLVLDNIDLGMLDVGLGDDTDEDGGGVEYVEGVWREEE